MRKLDGEVFTYAKHSKKELVLREGATWHSFGLGDANYQLVEREGPTWATVPKIRAWSGYSVASYPQLVQTVAHIASGNRLLLLYFRGQQRDYKDRNGRTTLYPSICRPKGARLAKQRLQERNEVLRQAMLLLKGDANLDLRLRIHSHPEAPMALLQHYELCRTPLLDVTRSLRVAASFALLDGAAEGYVFVIGMPYPHGSISHLVDHEIRVVDLQSVCPYRALRPHYQEGVLIGRYPWRGEKDAGDNAAYRLVAKLHLLNNDGKFWAAGFHALPRKALLPKDDPYGDQLRSVLRPILDARSDTDD